MVTLPDRDESRRRFASLDANDRRMLTRAVNRGEAVPKRKLAPEAVWIARRQAMFWKFGWLIAPVMGLIQTIMVPLDVVVINTVLASLALGGLSLFFFRRARRAEAANLALVAGPGRGGQVRHPGQAAFGRHLPTSKDAEVARTDGDLGSDRGSVDGTQPERPLPDRRPYRPRGRKRR